MAGAASFTTARSSCRRSNFYLFYCSRTLTVIMGSAPSARAFPDCDNSSTHFQISLIFPVHFWRWPAQNTTRRFCAQGIVEENLNDSRNSRRGSLLSDPHIVHRVPLPGRVRPYHPFGNNLPAESLYAFKVLPLSRDQRIEVNHPASLAQPEGFR